MVDWWAVGICIYELLCGKHPHYVKGMDKKDWKKKITEDDIKFDENITYSDEIKDLIKGLLTRD